MKLKQKKLEEDAKKKQAQKKKQKIAQIKSTNREMCYCQALIHEFFSNCTECGRIIWVVEGEGDCLFCGNYVESHTVIPDIDQVDDPNYKKALENRRKLLEFDCNEIVHSGIKDQTSDWYEIENDVWQSREQRDFAKKIREYEEKRIVEEAEALYVSIGTGKKVVSLAKGVTKTQEQMIQEANQYYNELANERIYNNMVEEDEEGIKEGFKDIRIKSWEFLDEKSKELLRKLKEDAKMAELELIQKSMKKDEEIKEKTAIQNFLGDRLQSENPFDEFQRELEKALKRREIEEQNKEKSENSKVEEIPKQDIQKQDIPKQYIQQQNTQKQEIKSKEVKKKNGRK